MPAVEVSGLAKRYDRVEAVRDVSFSAAEGAVTALLGPNGAGKTTTVGICAGWLGRDAGDVRVLGLDPARERATLTGRLGVMPQAGGSSAAGVYPSLRVREALELFAAMYARPQPVDALLERVGLATRAGSAWRQLSGGEQQRLSLALALVGRPEAVFLDEPTAGLDVAARHDVRSLVTDLRASGVAVLLTTHDLQEAEQLADHVVIVAGGRVVASGTPAALTHGGPAELSFTAPPGLDLVALGAALPEGTTAIETVPGQYVVGPRVDPGVVAAVTAWCAEAGVMPDRLTTQARSLESVFLELTGEDAR